MKETSSPFTLLMEIRRVELLNDRTGLVMDIKEESYNEAIEKLRLIVEAIEKGDLEVDLLSEKVKEASRLIKLCKDKLYKADLEVKKVLEELE